MIKYSPTLVLILVITLLSLLIRLVGVGTLPKVLNRDEAALAYNAVLLKETGTDEWGKSWPLVLESFGDYKLPGYVMVLVGLFSFLPQTEWVVRLPAVLAGTALIPLGYWLARNVGYKQPEALLYAVMIAGSNVLFFYSRMAFEALLGLALWMLFFCLITHLKSRKKLATNWWWFDLAAIVVALLAIFTYNTPFLLLPFTVLTLPLLRGLRNWSRWLPLAMGLTMVFIVGLVVLTPATAQKKSITIFSDANVQLQLVEYRQSLPSAWQSVLGNKYIYYLGLMGQRFVASLTPKFLVLQGGSHPWHSIEGASHFGWTIYGLGIVGLVGIPIRLLQQVRQRVKLTSILGAWPLVLLWLTLTSLAPSVVTVDAPHATRSLPFFWWWIMLAVEGVNILTSIARQRLKLAADRNPPLLLGTLILVLVIEFAAYLTNYFLYYPNRHPSQIKVGFDQVVRQVEEKYPDRPIAVVDGDGHHYIMTAWYLHIPPAEYFDTVVRQQPNQLGFRYGEQVSHYHFITHAEDREKTGENVMIDWQDDQWSIKEF